MYADVAVCLPLSRTFVYRITEPVAIASRVKVSFRGREVEGFVVGLRKDPPQAVDVLPIQSLIDPEPLLRPDIFQLCCWIADYYLAPLGEVLKSALPPAITRKHIERFNPVRLPSRESEFQNSNLEIPAAPFLLTTDQLKAL